VSGLVTAIGVGWAISWVTWASDYSRFVNPKVSSKSVFWYSYAGLFVPTVWLAILGASIASVTQSADPAKLVSSVVGGVVAGVVLADFYLLRRKQLDVAQLYADPKASIYGDVNWVGILAFLLGLACGWLFEFGLVGPLQGYISTHFLQGGDLSWFIGMVVAGG